MPALCLLFCGLMLSGPARADIGEVNESDPYLQCVPYARATSGVQIYGDAHRWWDQAAGRYERGNRPRPGAVMSFKAHGVMQLGHVATVSRIVDDRTVLISHANWSPIDGRRGRIETDVMVKDVSDANDWSKVRVWYGPLAALGTTEYPLYGFIYGDGTLRPYQPKYRMAAGDPPAGRANVVRLPYADGVFAMMSWSPPAGNGRHAPPPPPGSRLADLQSVVARLR